MNSQTFRGAGASVARVRGTARYASAIAGGAGVFFVFFFAVCGGCACALPIPKEGPLGTISVRFNTRPLGLRATAVKSNIFSVV